MALYDCGDPDCMPCKTQFRQGNETPLTDGDRAMIDAAWLKHKAAGEVARKMRDGLMPCPFCGGPAVSLWGAVHLEHTCGNAADSDCPGHQVMAPTDQWNRRALSAASGRAPANKEE